MSNIIVKRKPPSPPPPPQPVTSITATCFTDPRDKLQVQPVLSGVVEFRLKHVDSHDERRGRIITVNMRKSDFVIFLGACRELADTMVSPYDEV